MVWNWFGFNFNFSGGDLCGKCLGYGIIMGEICSYNMSIIFFELEKYDLGCLLMTYMK